MEINTDKVIEECGIEVSIDNIIEKISKPRLQY